MSLEQAILTHAESIRELAAAILKAGSGGPAAANISKTEAKPAPDKAPEAKKEQPKPAPEKKAASGNPGAAQETTDLGDAAPTIDYTTIRAKILDLTKQPEGRDRCSALLARFGVTKGPDLKAEQHVEFDDLITQTLAGEYDPRSAVDPDEGDMA